MLDGKQGLMKMKRRKFDLPGAGDSKWNCRAGVAEAVQMLDLAEKYDMPPLKSDYDEVLAFVYVWVVSLRILGLFIKATERWNPVNCLCYIIYGMWFGLGAGKILQLCHIFLRVFNLILSLLFFKKLKLNINLWKILQHRYCLFFWKADGLCEPLFVVSGQRQMAFGRCF